MDGRGDDRVLGDIGTNVVYEDDVVRGLAAQAVSR